MLSSVISLFCFLNLLLHTSSQATCPYPPPDGITLVNCGSSSDKSPDGRLWNGDSISNSKFTSSDLEESSESNATNQASGIDTVPFMTARISDSSFTYTFPNISHGPKFIRLYFYPDTYTSSKTSSDFNFNSSELLFTVTANNFTLLKNFSAFLNLFAPIPRERTTYVIKEFIVTVPENQTLNISFTPSPSSLAFINGIEIAPIPENLYIKDKDYSITLVNFQTPYDYHDFTAVETVYRLNVGGQFVSDPEMFRRWSDDTNYIDDRPVTYPQGSDDKIKYTQKTTPCAAPPVVYQTMRAMGPHRKENLKYNLTWKFSVDSGFDYLVRLHFCETDKFVNASAKRVFGIFVNDFQAAEALDVFYSAGGNDIPVYQDYIVRLPEENQKKKEIFIVLHPRSDVSFTDAILNGLEIFKLSKVDGDLSGPNAEQPFVLKQPQGDSRKESNSKPRVLLIIGVVIGVFSALCLLIFFIVYVTKAKKKGVDYRSNWLPFSYTSSSAPTSVLLLPIDLCRQFTLPEIRIATRNFDNENVIGSGGFGTVYKGFIQNGSVSVPVAIKRLELSSKQGFREFHTEIEMLSRLRHAHLVSLVGYCNEEDEMILVYEFMDQGNLQDHMYKAKKEHFPWKQRLKICIGAAKGLHYLHTGAKNTIIHRDVKSSNILLDSNFVAKVSDFGLSKIGPTNESQTHVSTAIRGTFGYLDPEYFRRQQLTDKSDVYSFGVVLLEVLYGRAPIIPTKPKEQVNLVQWTQKCSMKGTVAQSIDPELRGDIATVSLNKFMEIAESCVRDKATERPIIGDVVWGLEFALQLQETTEKNVDDGDDNIGSERQKSSFVDYEGASSTDHDMFTSSSVPILTSSRDQSTVSISDSDPARPENVFSEIMNQDGR
ncbi:Malectin/receptor-like protein kinase family protein [Euphorbia peplus]|nr:Malectin/receptor-like protein kinase family protein [Euphorbia peplus]